MGALPGVGGDGAIRRAFSDVTRHAPPRQNARRPGPSCNAVAMPMVGTHRVGVCCSAPVGHAGPLFADASWSKTGTRRSCRQPRMRKAGACRQDQTRPHRMPQPHGSLCAGPKGRPSAGMRLPKVVETHGTQPGTIAHVCARRPTALMPLAFDGFVALSARAPSACLTGVERDRVMCPAPTFPASGGSLRTDVSRRPGDTSRRASSRKPVQHPPTSAQPDRTRPSPCSAVRRCGAVTDLIGRTMGPVAPRFGPDGAMATAKRAGHALSPP